MQERQNIKNRDGQHKNMYMFILVLSSSHFFLELLVLVLRKGFFQGCPSLINSYVFKGSTKNKIKMCNDDIKAYQPMAKHYYS
jgi:hypothetical protein